MCFQQVRLQWVKLQWAPTGKVTMGKVTMGKVTMGCDLQWLAGHCLLDKKYPWSEN